MAVAGEDVYCTLLMSDSYLPGAAVLAHSLRDCGTAKKLAVLITADSLLPSTIAELKSLYDYVIPVDAISNPNLENLHRLGRLDLRFAFTKIALWRQQQFRKICYLDADTVALRAPDELFDLQSSFAAAPDIGWPDCFNSGMMVLKPDMSEYWSLHTLASSGTSFDGADQGLLNEHFGSTPWERVSFTYNCTPSSGYQYEPAYRHFRSSISVVHFIGGGKPWHRGRNALDAAGSGVYKELLGRWWSVYDRHYRIQQSSALGFMQPSRQAVQSYVKDEQSQGAFEWASSGLARPALMQPISSADWEQRQNTASMVFSAAPSEPLEASAVTTERPFTESSHEYAENVEKNEPPPQGSPAPPPPPPEPTPEVRAFSPPQNQWDATRSEPPSNTKPEAKDFPSTRYEMSSDPALFHAPSSYPEVPKNFYYQPPAKSEAIESRIAIFPWEANASKPTRVFADDIQSGQDSSKGSSQGPSSPLQRPPPVGSVPTAVRHFGHQFPTVPPKDFSSSDLWNSFSRTNAWDEVSSIEQYVRALKETNTRKAPVQVLHDAFAAEAGKPTEVKDFATGSTGSTGPVSPRKRRESLILTDFPTEIERPSLPVTPAPIRRPTFWDTQAVSSAEDLEDLPAAQGVPDQEDWNPLEQLEQLRRSSIATATEETPLSPPRPLPMRPIPESSANLVSPPAAASEPNPFESSLALASSASTASSDTPASQQSKNSPRVSFKEPDFS